MEGSPNRSRRLHDLLALPARGVIALGRSSQRNDMFLDGPLSAAETWQQTVSCLWFQANHATYLLSMEAFVEAKRTLFILSVLLCFINANGSWAAKPSCSCYLHWEIHCPKSKWESNNASSFRRHSSRCKFQTTENYFVPTVPWWWTSFFLQVVILTDVYAHLEHIFAVSFLKNLCGKKQAHHPGVSEGASLEQRHMIIQKRRWQTQVTDTTASVDIF